MAAILVCPAGGRAQVGAVRASAFAALHPAWQGTLGNFLRHVDLSDVPDSPSMDDWAMRDTFAPVIGRLQTFHTPESFSRQDAASRRADFIRALGMARADMAERASRLTALAGTENLDEWQLREVAAQLAEIAGRWGDYLPPGQLDQARQSAELAHRRLHETARARVETAARRAAPDELNAAEEVMPVMVGERTYFLSPREIALTLTKRRSLYYYNGISSQYGHEPLETLKSYLAAGGKLSPNGWRLHREISQELLPRAQSQELTALIRDVLQPRILSDFPAHREAIASRIAFLARHEEASGRDERTAAVLARLQAASLRFQKDIRDYKDALWELRIMRRRLANTARRHKRAAWYPAAQAEMDRLRKDSDYRAYFHLRRLDMRGLRWRILGKDDRATREARRREIAALEARLGLDRVKGVRDRIEYEVESQELRWFAGNYNGLFKYKDDWFVWYAAGEPGISREDFSAIKGQFAKDGLIFEFRPESSGRMYWREMFHGPPSQVHPRSRIDKLTHDTLAPGGNVFREELSRVYAATAELRDAARAAFEAAWGSMNMMISGVTFHLFDEQAALYARDWEALRANAGRTPRELTLHDVAHLPKARAPRPTLPAGFSDSGASERLLAHLTSPEHFGLPAGTDLAETIGNEQYQDWLALNRTVLALARKESRLSMEDVSEIFRIAVRSTSRHRPVGWRTDAQRHTIYPGGIASGGLWYFELAQESQFFRNHRFQSDPRLVRNGTSWVGTPRMTYPEPDPKMRDRVADLVEAYNRARQKGADPVVAAVLLQRDIVALHPLTDGNGRASRALLDLELLKLGLFPPQLPSAEIDLMMTPERYAAFVKDAAQRGISAVGNR